MQNFAFSAIKAPFEETLAFFEAWCAKLYRETYDPEELQSGRGGLGVACDGTDTVHIRSFCESHLEIDDVILADARLIALNSAPGWTLLEGPGEQALLNDEAPELMARVLGKEVFFFTSDVQDFEKNRVETTVFQVRHPVGEKRYVSVDPDYLYRGGEVVTRHVFYAEGKPHPAEDLDRYERRGPRNKLNADELCAIMARIELRADSFIEHREADRVVLLQPKGAGRPLQPSADLESAVDEGWPWNDDPYR